jgi:hypothetical protein
MNSFRLNPLAIRWLRAEGSESGQGEGPDWDLSLLRLMSRGEVVVVGDVLVDRAVLRQRFACVSDRCAPGPSRGKFRSCCADALVSLSRAEDQRLRRRGDLLDWMKTREPRLAPCLNRDFYRQEGEPGLARPGRRCVFSQLERGRILCHLHAYARHARLDRGQLQPVSCRLFPLIVVDRGQGRVLLTVVARHTRRLVSAYPAHRYPCLADTSLPPLYQSMRGDLDWLFGRGFAKALAAGAAKSLRPTSARTRSK